MNDPDSETAPVVGSVPGIGASSGGSNLDAVEEGALDPRAILEQWAIGTSGGAYMAGLENRPVIERTQGSYLYDTKGNAYLDFGSGQMGGALGHNHPKIAASIRESAERAIHSTNTYLNVDRLRLHEKLGKLLTAPLQKSLFLVTGSDSVEAAVDLARKATGGTEVLSFHTGLHGSTSFVTRSLSFAWERKRHAINAPSIAPILAPHCYRCPVKQTFPSCDYLCLEVSLELADAHFPAKPAAIVTEPIMSAGGIIEPPPGYMQELRKAADERGMLLVNDEAQTGLGKTGRVWGHEHSGVVPDVMAVSKHFGGGVPISAVCATAVAADAAVENGYFATRSHATDPLLCAAGSASLDILVDEDIPGKAAAIEARIKEHFTELGNDCELVGDIRGRGVLLGIELVEEREHKTPANAAAQHVLDYCQRAGLILQLRGTQGDRNVLRLVPPMTASAADVDKALNILSEAILDAR